MGVDRESEWDAAECVKSELLSGWAAGSRPHPALIAHSKSPSNEALMQFEMLLVHFPHNYNGMANATITIAITVG